MKNNTLKYSILSLTLAGCTTLPASGPTSVDVKRDASFVLKSPPKSRAAAGDVKQHKTLQYAFVDLNYKTLPYIQKVANTPMPGDIWQKVSRPVNLPVSIGDTLQITIYEAQSGGLFVPIEAGVRPGNFITLPNQIVDQSGKIQVPYAGSVQAAGKSLAEIGDNIVKRLADRAIEPQVVVSYADRRGSQVSVVGDVNSAGRFDLNFSGERVLDAIARAGGPRFSGYETYVTLQRDGKETTLLLDDIITHPDENIYLRPRDTLYVYREPKRFMVFGASNNNGYFPFERRDLNLSEAMGRARGLRDIQADPSEVYVYRQQRKADLDAMGIDTAAIESTSVPTIYHVNLKDPVGFFMTQEFAMNDNDIVYIANADSVDFLKFLDVVNAAAITNNNVDATGL